MNNKFINKYSIDINQGVILIDILLALSLATLFTAIITESSIGARQIFDRAYERAELLDALESSASTTSMSRPFGNDRIETDVTVITSSFRGLASGGLTSESISFVKVSARDPAHIADAVGTPLCAVDFSAHETVGSYAFLHPDAVNSGHIFNPAMISITPIILPINPLLPLTDLEVKNGIAYVSDDSSIASDPDLFVVDFKNRANPAVLSFINTGPGIAGIALAGTRIYAAAASTAAQLHIIRMDSLNSLTLEKKYQLPPPSATATEPMASAIFFDRNKVYLGTEKWDGDEFSVIDVSDPAQPAKISGFETSSKINDIFMRDGVAYIADSDEKQLRAIDISKLSSPILIDSVNPSGWSRQEGKTLSYFEDSLGLGRTSGGFNIATDHEAFTWAAASSSPASSSTPPSISLSVYHSIDISGGVYGMIADRSHIYLTTRQVDKEFQIFDRPLSTTTTVSYPLPVAPQTLTCDGSHLYILAATAPVIYEISFN